MCYSAMVKRDIDYLGDRFGATLVRGQLDDYLRAVAQNPKRFPPLEPRIFPGHYAPVVHLGPGGERQIRQMRYGSFPPASMGTSKKYTSFNARRDNLQSPFWSNAYAQNHGFVVLEGFFEWVAVRDLLSAGHITIDQVRAEFARQAELRKDRILAAGKKYKPTATEQKDARMRQIVIEFRPPLGTEMIVPVIFSKVRHEDGREDMGFAIITDDPPPEIVAAGHDRCPIIVTREAVLEWIDIHGKDRHQFGQILAQRQQISFGHELDEAA